MLRKLILSSVAALTISASHALADDPLFQDLGGRDGIVTIVNDTPRTSSPIRASRRPSIKRIWTASRRT